MIGMMNSGNDVPVEFYSSPKQSSLYAARHRKSTITYTEDGRTLLNGNLSISKTPDQMWQEVLMRAVCHSAYKKNIERGRSKSKIRRLIEQLSIQSNDDVTSPTIATEYEERKSKRDKRGRPVASPSTSQQSSPSSISSNSTAPYVTTIAIRPDNEND